MTKCISSVAAALLAVALLGGCGGSDGGDDGGATTTVTTLAGPPGSPEVAAFCEEAEAVGAELEDAVANAGEGPVDPTEVVQRANQLTGQVPALATAHPDEVDRINECSELLSVSPGG